MILYRGIVTASGEDDGKPRPFVEVPELGAGYEFGPLPTVVWGLDKGDKVLVGSMSGILEDLVVIGRFQEVNVGASGAELAQLAGASLTGSTISWGSAPFLDEKYTHAGDRLTARFEGLYRVSVHVAIVGGFPPHPVHPPALERTVWVAVDGAAVDGLLVLSMPQDNYKVSGTLTTVVEMGAGSFLEIGTAGGGSLIANGSTLNVERIDR